MNKKTSIFCILIFCVVSAMPQSSVSDMRLNGKVRIMFSYKHQVKNIVIEDNKLLPYDKDKLLHHVEYIFDKNGALLAENRFDKQDIIDISFIYEYNEAGKLIDLTIAKAGKILVGRTEYQYNKDGNKTQEIEYDNRDSLKTTTIFKYDSLGKLISEKMYNNANRLVKDIHYQYDKRGNLISVNSLKTTNLANKPYQEIQKFDNRNNLIYKSFTQFDTLKWEYFATYNKNDSLTYEELKDGMGKLQSYSKLTFKKGKRILLKQYKQNSEWETTYQYDKNGRVFVEKIYSCVSNKKILFSTRTYFYDEKENLIYCIEKDEITGFNLVHYQRYIYF